MVEVRFACIPGVGGVECTLDGVTQVSNASGIASFTGISQGAHGYSVKAPPGWVLVSGEDPFKRPLFQSGTTNIEWVPIPGQPWPEQNPWMMMFNFKEGTTPPPPPPPPPVPSEELIEKIVAVGLLGGLIVWFSFRT